MFSGFAIEVRADSDHRRSTLRFRRRRSALRATYRGRRVTPWIDAAMLAELLTSVASEEQMAYQWGETKITSGRGAVHISIVMEVASHWLSEQERRGLLVLATRPRPGRRVDRDRQARQIARRP